LFVVSLLPHPAWMKHLSATKNVSPKAQGVMSFIKILIKLYLIFCLPCCTSPTVIYTCLSFTCFADAGGCTVFQCCASVILAKPELNLSKPLHSVSHRVCCDRAGNESDSWVRRCCYLPLSKSLEILMVSVLLFYFLSPVRSSKDKQMSKDPRVLVGVWLVSLFF